MVLGDLTMSITGSTLLPGMTSQTVDVASREIAILKELRQTLMNMGGWRWMSTANVTMPTVGTVNLLDSVTAIQTLLAAGGWRW